MTTTTSVFAIACTLALLGGCATGTPTGTGNSVRAIMASQVVPPQVRPDTGSNAAAAVAAYANYQRSYVTPVSQTDTLTFGSK